MKKNVETISIRGFARLCGKNHTWVRRRIKDGTLPVADDGTVPVEEGLDAFKKMVGNLAKTAKEAEKISTDIDPKEIGLEGVNLKNPVEVAHAFSVARLLEKQVTARVKTAEMELKAIELEAKKGNFIPKEEVLADARRVASLVREKLLTIPIRYAGQLEGRTQREIEGVLDHVIDEVLQSLNESKFVEQ